MGALWTRVPAFRDTLTSSICACSRTRRFAERQYALLACALWPRGVGFDLGVWSGRGEAAAEAAVDAKREAGIFDDGSIDGDVSPAREGGERGAHFGHGEVLADAASGTEPEREQCMVLFARVAVMS